MLDMSKLPSHKIENGVVIFDEPYKVNSLDDLVTFMQSIMQCDLLVTDEEPTFYIHAFAKDTKYNDNLYNYFIQNEDKGWTCMGGLTQNQVVLPV